MADRIGAERTDPGSGLVYRPMGAGQPEALLLLLHGVGGNELQMEPLAAGQNPRLRVLLVRGPLDLGPGRHGWFEVQFSPQGSIINADQAEASRQQLVAFVEGAQAMTGLPPARTLIAGFSQGGIMSAGVALTRPRLVAGFGLLSGRILPELKPDLAPREDLARLAGYVSHGTEDRVLPVAHADRSEAWLGELGVPLERHRYDAGHQLTPAMEKDFRAWVEARLF